MNAKSERFHWKVNIELLHITSHISNDKSHKCRHDIINSEGRPNLPWTQCNRKCQLDTNCDQSPISLHEWKHFPRYWPFVRVIHRSPVNSPHKASDAELWCFLWSAPWINGWGNDHEARDSRRHPCHYDVTVMNALPIKIGIRWKYRFTLTSIPTKWSLRAVCCRGVCKHSLRSNVNTWIILRLVFIDFELREDKNRW